MNDKIEEIKFGQHEALVVKERIKFGRHQVRDVTEMVRGRKYKKHCRLMSTISFTFVNVSSDDEVIYVEYDDGKKEVLYQTDYNLRSYDNGCWNDTNWIETIKPLKRKKNNG